MVNRLEGRMQAPRYSQLEFPFYYWKNDQFACLSCFDHYFYHRHIPEEEIASYHLDEDEIGLVIDELEDHEFEA